MFEKGLYLIENGAAMIRNPHDGFQPGELGRGDFFGEDDALLETDGFCSLGEIIATGEDPVECYFISAENLRRIPLWELKRLREFSS